MDPDIFVLSHIPSLGELSPNTIVTATETCPHCAHKAYTFEKISYCFHRWSGEDLIECADIYYLASHRLKQALEEKQVQGVSFQKCEVEIADFFIKGQNNWSEELPDFYLLHIANELDGPERWWTRENQCPACGHQKWIFTIEGIQSSIAAETRIRYYPRQVYRCQWKGEDIFKLQDPGPPVVTRRFVDILNTLGQFQYKLKPAQWVSKDDYGI